MSHQVTQIQVFVSCPGDVEMEKQIVGHICNRLNSLYATRGCNIHLLVRDWREITGKFGPRPQQIINETINSYDVYVGILWMRFGTPPGATNRETGEDYQSGTEEEFHLAYEEWQKDPQSLNIFIYFKDSKPANTIEETEQLLKVQKFREQLNPKGWVNRFKDIDQFKDSVYDVLNGIALKICLEKKAQIKQALTGNSRTTPPAIDKETLNALIQTFYKGLEKIPYYIPRTLKRSSDETIKLPPVFQVEEYETLSEIILKTPKIVLLGNAGTGKSVELQQVAAKFADKASPFIPIYKRLNTYIDEEIQDFLPTGWKKIDAQILLVLLDGLDEIQPHLFNQAIRRILKFNEKYSDVRLIISCRSNFFEIPTENSLGTLPGFDCFYINDLSLAEIRKYLASKNIDAEKFIHEVYKNGFLDILVKPFFLNILVSHFDRYKELGENRADIIKGFIKSRIKLDEDHFRTTVDTEPIKSEIIQLLQRVAFAMEMLGRNYIFTDELHKVAGTHGNMKLLKYFTAFNKRNELENSWQFEHNNIQEYLAAMALSERGLDRIKDAISFAPQYTKVKPSWVNTLSFLISISDEGEVSALINWILEAEPEVMIKFEKDRVDKKFRIKLFKEIFNGYKEKGIWLKSNKFSDSELALFSQTSETVDFLIAELENSSNTRIVKMNAIHILDGMNPSLISPIQLEQIKQASFRLIENNEDDTGLIYSTLRGMSELKLNDKETIDRILVRLGKRRNQYIRAGLYKIIGDSLFVNDYIDIFIDGIFISDDEEFGDDREEISLADESWLLKEGLSKADSRESIRKLLKYFREPADRRHINFYEKKEVFNNIVRNSIREYVRDKSLFEDIFQVFINSAKLHELDYASTLKTFFEQTGTKEKAFVLLWRYLDLQSYEKGLLLALLVDRNIINYLVGEYIKRNFTNEDIVSLHKNMQWFLGKVGNDRSLIAYLETKFEQAEGVELEPTPVIDYEILKLAKLQESFNLLFDISNFLAEIKRVFDEFGSEEINYDELWEVRRRNDQLLDEYYVSSALLLLRDFTQDRSKVTFEKIKNWVNEGPTFQNYQINQIYNYLRNNQKLTINSNQRDLIQKWSLTAADNLNWQKIVYRRGNMEDSISINHNAEILWYFIRNWSISIPLEQLVKFTLFKDFSNNRDNDSTDEIDFIEAELGKDVVAKKVIENIRNGLNISWIWKTNSLYAITNNLVEVFPEIVKGLTDESMSEFQRRDVLGHYFKKVGNVAALKEVLSAVSLGSLGWQIIDLLMSLESEYAFLIDFLEGILKNEAQTIVIQIEAAKRLIVLNNMLGLSFFINYLIDKNDISLDYHHLDFLTKLTTTDAIPYLLKLLYLSKQTHFQEDKYNSLESITLTSIHNIGMLSEANLDIVKKALLHFIKEYQSNIKHINFLHVTIERMEEQYYINKSKSCTIEEAIKILDS